MYKKYQQLLLIYCDPMSLRKMSCLRWDSNPLHSTYSTCTCSLYSLNWCIQNRHTVMFPIILNCDVCDVHRNVFYTSGWTRTHDTLYSIDVVYNVGVEKHCDAYHKNCGITKLETECIKNLFQRHACTC